MEHCVGGVCRSEEKVMLFKLKMKDDLSLADSFVKREKVVKSLPVEGVILEGPPFELIG